MIKYRYFNASSDILLTFAISKNKYRTKKVIPKSADAFPDTQNKKKTVLSLYIYTNMTLRYASPW